MNKKRARSNGTKKPSIKLDSLLREGRLKTVDPDIGDVWEELHKINKMEERAFNKKIERVKTKISKLKIKLPSKSKSKKLTKIPNKNSNIRKFFINRTSRVGVAVILIFICLAVYRNSSSNNEKTNQLGAKTSTTSKPST